MYSSVFFFSRYFFFALFFAGWIFVFVVSVLYINLSSTRLFLPIVLQFFVCCCFFCAVVVVVVLDIIIVIAAVTLCAGNDVGVRQHLS